MESENYQKQEESKLIEYLAGQLGIMGVLYTYEEADFRRIESELEKLKKANINFNTSEISKMLEELISLGYVSQKGDSYSLTLEGLNYVAEFPFGYAALDDAPSEN